MADSGHDDLADALARMASGDVAPSEHLPHGEDGPPPAPAPVKPPAAPVRPPAAPVKPTSAPVKPTSAPVKPPAAPVRPAVGKAAPVARPATGAPAAKTPATPVAKSAPPARPATPGTAPVAAPAARAPRPAAPTAAASSQPAASTPAPTARPQRPTAPVSRPVAPPPQDVPPTPVDESPVIEDDDDAVIVPAYESSKLARPSTAVANARAATAKKKRLEFRRTCIPVLLTTGVLMILFGAAKFAIGDESSLSALDNTVPVVLFAGAAVLLGLAAINMVSVQKEMADDAAAGK